MIEVSVNTPIRLGLTGVDEIVQNVRTILTTAQGTVPLDRDFGIDLASYDEPMNLAKARLSSAILFAITDYEPRAIVREVQFDEDHQLGKLVPRVYIDIVEGGG